MNCSGLLYLSFSWNIFNVRNQISCSDWIDFFVCIFVNAKPTNSVEEKKYKFCCKNNEKSSANKSNIKIAQTNLFNPLACSQTELKINSKTLQNKSSLEIWILQFFFFACYICSTRPHKKYAQSITFIKMNIEKKRLRANEIIKKSFASRSMFMAIENRSYMLTSCSCSCSTPA